MALPAACVRSQIEDGPAVRCIRYGGEPDRACDICVSNALALLSSSQTHHATCSESSLVLTLTPRWIQGVNDSSRASNPLVAPRAPGGWRCIHTRELIIFSLLACLSGAACANTTKSRSLISRAYIQMARCGYGTLFWTEVNVTRTSHDVGRASRGELS